MSASSDIRDTFFQECDELLEALEEGLQQIEDDLDAGAGDPETVNAVFRAVHSIKGGAGAFALDDLVSFSHKFETVLDAVRSDTLEPTHELLSVFFRANDRLVDLVTAARDDLEVDAEAGASIEEALSGFMTGEEEVDDSETAEFVPMGLALDLDLGEPGPLPDLGETDDQGANAPAGFLIALKPLDALYANGNDVAHLLRGLSELGRMETEVALGDLPDFDDLSPRSAALSWSIRLYTDEPEHVVIDVFDFVEGLCELAIEPLPGDEPAQEPEPSATETDCSAEAGEAKVEEALAPAPPAAREAQASKSATDTAASGNQKANKATIRVDLERVDRLINIVGELVINQAMLSQCAKDAGVGSGSEMAAGLDEFRQLSREIQESVMAIRAQPVKSLFQRMSRIVREGAAATGKKVRLVTIGENTEVDKTVIERLADPLTHMVRNAIDHGLESTEARIAADKDAQGTVTLTAAHRSGRVFIEVADNGGGINREKVLQIAVNKGLVPADADLSDAEIDALIFLPGFSTAGEVSNLSGRGVGMDVVKSAIQALGGRVVIQSDPGKGSTFVISLPLTLAVMEGMVVDVAGQTMIVPLTAITETMKASAAEIHLMGTGDQVVHVRGEFLPIIDLAAAFAYRAPQQYDPEQVLLLVTSDNHQTFALTVDAIHDQRQVVIKGLKENYGELTGVAAATILGDGRIALIIDTDAIYATNSAPSAIHSNTFQMMGAAS